MRKLIITFIKEQILFSISTLGSAGLILFFYRLELGHEAEIGYPLLMVLFMYLLILSIKFVHFSRFNTLLKLSSHSPYPFYSNSKQEQLVFDSIFSIHQSYLQNLHALEQKNNEHLEIISQAIHNFKIPVSVIELILEDLSENEIEQEIITKIKSENKKIQHSLEQVISFLRLDSFEKDYNLETVNLIDELRNRINAKKDYFIYNHVYPKFEPLENTCLILTDRKWNALLLDQLISNAIKYSSIKGKGYHVEFEIFHDKDAVHLQIKDHGIGIASHDMPRIFQPFFTGENGRKVGSSTGIGLYICKKIALLLGHNIQITSVQGVGTKATITYLTKM